MRHGKAHRRLVGFGIVAVWLATGFAAHIVFSDTNSYADVRAPRVFERLRLRSRSRMTWRDRLELGLEIGRRWQHDELPIHEVRVEDPDEVEVFVMLRQLDRVPEAYQRYLNAAGGQIVIYEGVLTDQPEWLGHRGRKVDLWEGDERTWDEVEFAYTGTHHRAFLQHGYKGSARHRDGAVIHEYGHMLDHMLGTARGVGWLSSTARFRRVHEVTLATSDTGWVGRIERPVRSRRELFAEGFEAFYYSRETRLRQAREQRFLYRYYVDLEEEFIEKSYAEVEARVSAEFARRRRTEGQRTTATAR